MEIYEIHSSLSSELSLWKDVCRLANIHSYLKEGFYTRFCFFYVTAILSLGWDWGWFWLFGALIGLFNGVGVGFKNYFWVF